MNVIGAAEVPADVQFVRVPEAPYVPASSTTVAPAGAELTALPNVCHGADRVPGLLSDPAGDTYNASDGTAGIGTPGGGWAFADALANAITLITAHTTAGLKNRIDLSLQTTVTRW